MSRKPAFLQYASSLFANRSSQRAWKHLTPGVAPNLALLGNTISVATEGDKEESYKFLLNCSRAWDRTFIVPGPLEYSSSSSSRRAYPYQMDSIREIFKEVGDKGGQLILMDQAEYVFPKENRVLLGTYGWPSFSKEMGQGQGWPEDNIWTGVGGYLNRMDAKTFQAMQEWDLTWLYKKIMWYTYNKTYSYKMIILTHSLCSPYLLQNRLGPRSVMDVVHPSYFDMFQGNNSPIESWLCGAGGSCVSGFLNKQTFAAVNSFYGEDNKPNRHFMGHRVLCLKTE